MIRFHLSELNLFSRIPSFLGEISVFSFFSHGADDIVIRTRPGTHSTDSSSDGKIRSGYACQRPIVKTLELGPGTTLGQIDTMATTCPTPVVAPCLPDWMAPSGDGTYFIIARDLSVAVGLCSVIA